MKKNEGYSIGKGVVGTALFGTGGAVMGINGKSKTYYLCAECGQTLTYTMPDKDKIAINEALTHPNDTASQITLEINKIIYPNIEWSKDS